MARPSTTEPPAADSLATYRAKRDFAKTAEPSDRRGRLSASPKFKR